MGVQRSKGPYYLMIVKSSGSDGIDTVYPDFVSQDYASATEKAETFLKSDFSIISVSVLGEISKMERVTKVAVTGFRARPRRGKKHESDLIAPLGSKCYLCGKMAVTQVESSEGTQYVCIGCK